VPPDWIKRKANPVNEHPQVGAFLHAAATMRENRYWARNPREQLAFLGALRDVMTEASFHLDRNDVLNPAALEAFAATAGAQRAAPWLDASAESVLLSGMDAAIQRCLAALETTDNTGGDPMAWSTSLDQPAPPS
jgi:hypothetical protein